MHTYFFLSVSEQLNTRESTGFNNDHYSLSEWETWLRALIPLASTGGSGHAHRKNNGKYQVWERVRAHGSDFTEMSYAYMNQSCIFCTSTSPLSAIIRLAKCIPTAQS